MFRFNFFSDGVLATRYLNIFYEFSFPLKFSPEINVLFSFSNTQKLELLFDDNFHNFKRICHPTYLNDSFYIIYLCIHQLTPSSGRHINFTDRN